MTIPSEPELPQYGFGRVLAVWAAAAVPMALLGWVASPMLAGGIDARAGIPGTARVSLMTAGLAWQFVLSLLLVRGEAGRLDWPTLRARLRLGSPRHPRTLARDRRLWLWLIPFAVLFMAEMFVVSPPLHKAWVAAFPFLAEPAEFRFAALLESPENRALLVGAWWFYGLFLLLAVFNTVLGEELLFRGLLLPRMRGRFGRWDWLGNGVLFGLYHLHQPWGIPGGLIAGSLFFALPATLFRSTWMAIAIHSGQSLFFAIVLLPVVLGRA